MAVLKEIIISLSCLETEFFQENIQQICEQFKYMNDQHEIGMALFECFETLPILFQQLLITKLKQFDQISYQIYYQAGKALLKAYKANKDSSCQVLSAQCLLKTCKEASQQSIVQIIDLISHEEFG